MHLWGNALPRAIEQLFHVSFGHAVARLHLLSTLNEVFGSGDHLGKPRVKHRHMSAPSRT
ncbi:Uncharacterised protein [Mycobacteroides abscessus subsp. abscessus]|nr:Uncharacterised protein [Mycobacteroides abscessus subsp. abscessus]